MVTTSAMSRALGSSSGPASLIGRILGQGNNIIERAVGHPVQAVAPVAPSTSNPVSPNIAAPPTPAPRTDTPTAPNPNGGIEAKPVGTTFTNTFGQTATSPARNPLVDLGSNHIDGLTDRNALNAWDEAHSTATLANTTYGQQYADTVSRLMEGEAGQEKVLNETRTRNVADDLEQYANRGLSSGSVEYINDASGYRDLLNTQGQLRNDTLSKIGDSFYQTLLGSQGVAANLGNAKSSSLAAQAAANSTRRNQAAYDRWLKKLNKKKGK